VALLEPPISENCEARVQDKLYIFMLMQFLLLCKVVVPPFTSTSFEWHVNSSSS
jgi:hypothetical protein